MHLFVFEPLSVVRMKWSLSNLQPKVPKLLSASNAAENQQTVPSDNNPSTAGGLLSVAVMPHGKVELLTDASDESSTSSDGEKNRLLAVVRAQDEKIAALLQTQNVEQTVLAETQGTLQTLKVTHNTAIHEKETLIALLKVELGSLNRRIDCYETDLYDEDLIGGMAELVAEGRQGGKNWKEGQHELNEEYLKQLELKLCKAMHNLEVMDNQVELLKKNAFDFAKQLREDMKKDREKQDSVEIDYLNRLVQMENEKRRTNELHAAKLGSREEQIAALNNTIEELKDFADENDCDDNEAKVGKIDSVLALNVLKEQFDSLSRKNDALQQAYFRESADYQEEINHLKEANEKKQKKNCILESTNDCTAASPEDDLNCNDQIRTSDITADAISSLEADSTWPAREWKHEEQQNKNYEIDNKKEDEEKRSQSSFFSWIKPAPPQV